MKNTILVFLMLIGALTSGAQNTDMDRVMNILSSDTINSLEVEQLVNEFIQESNPYVARTLVEATKISYPTEKLSWMLHPELPFESELTIEIANEYGDWSGKLKKLKKSKDRKNFLDSIQNVQTIDFWHKIQKGRQMSTVFRYLKRNAVSDYYDALIEESRSDIFQYEIALRDAVEFADISKNKKQYTEYNSKLEGMLGRFEANRAQFFKSLPSDLGTFTKKIREDEKSKWYVEEKETVKVTPRETFMAIGFGTVALILLIFYFVLQDRYKTSINSVKKEMENHKKVAASHQETYAQVKEEAKKSVETAQRHFAGKEEEYLQKIKYIADQQQDVKSELHQLQMEAKSSMDKLAKDNSPQNWMELQNLISRKLNQLREKL
ncbi:MAG: hypothetical protein R2809_13065 [Flavobacteriales bacterium]